VRYVTVKGRVRRRRSRSAGQQHASGDRSAARRGDGDFGPPGQLPFACLALATEMLPARCALIHFFDVEKRQWIVACTRGKDTQKLLTMNTPESDDLLRAAARHRRAIVTASVGSVSVAGRYSMVSSSPCRHT